MHIEIRHDDTIQGPEEVQAHIRATIGDVLSRFADQITSVEVHLADENGVKKGTDDVRVTVQVKLAGRPPTAVTHHASDLYISVDGAAEKMARSLEHTLGKLRDSAPTA